ncbi:PfkB family carbohydrate kinase [Deinococcus pimensis]|uniref:PfkB family carbohydrate kinase n=1 Tax=Deinococcus pimensis TaxID=309888 RepID=UPI0004BA001B|nr:PfkB family carbohydrate kinase [Deinococcus pimensis]
MRRLLGLGDNTADLYVTSGTMYPGGNAVNVAALTARLGHEASYLGVLGTDAPGDLILGALRAEGVDVSRCRRVPGPTSWSRVVHHENDRTFDGSDAGVSRAWDLGPEDHAWIGAHELTHTSLYSGLGPHLSAVRKAAPLLTHDFSSEWTDEDLRATAPLLDVAFLSAADLDEDACVNLARSVAALGTGVVIVTRGERGALALSDGRIHTQAAEPADVVDTLGAGDAFIAGFLGVWTPTRDVPSALSAGAHEAARNCAVRGAFGHGAPIPESHPAGGPERPSPADTR